MREIKFRAWDKELKTPMEYDAPIELASKGYILMQYTGLKDKNGKEIYEGDILKSPSGNLFEIRYVVRESVEGNDVYDDAKSGFYAFFTEKDFSGLHQVNQHEVIGNIYENPELLKGGE